MLNYVHLSGACTVLQRETHLSDLEKKDPSGAGELRRRSLDNHGYLSVSGPISLSPLSLSLCSHNPLTPQSSDGLPMRAKTAPDPNFPTAGARRGCSPCALVYSRWKMGRRRRTVRHLTGVCNPAAPSGAAESAPSPGTGGLRAQSASAISWSVPRIASRKRTAPVLQL